MTYGFLVDSNNCVGCHTCAVACKDANSYELGCGFREVKTFCTGEFPEVAMYHVSLIDAQVKEAPKTGEMKRCDFCANIRAQGEQPACVAACPMRCIEWGDLDELVARHPGKRVESSFPAIDALGQSQGHCLYILKDCMLDEDYDEVVL